jgi:hypothetical protein
MKKLKGLFTAGITETAALNLYRAPDQVIAPSSVY